MKVFKTERGKGKIKLFDMHVHTKGISLCSRLSAGDLCRALKEDQTDGFVLTNHYSPAHLRGSLGQWLKNYQEEYERTAEEAERWGLRALFGMEVTLGTRDFLLYGVTPECLYGSERPLWEYTLEELWEFAHEREALLVHAHPYRGGGVPADFRYLDGVEINCHPLYLQNAKEEVTAYAKEHRLFVTCGSDYHGDVYKAHCGVWLPDGLSGEKELAMFLKSGQPELLVHDIDPRRAEQTNIYNRNRRKDS